MGYIAVEKHLFYLEANRNSAGQTHLWVHNIRLPWGQGTRGRTVRYMDEEQFGGVKGRVNGQSIRDLTDFFLGKGRYNHPKLIVANATPRDIMTRPEISQKFSAQYKGKLSRVSGVGAPVDNPLGESRVAGVERHYKPEYHKHFFNTAWLVIDPTRPGRQRVPRDRAVRLAHGELRQEFANKLYKGHHGYRKIMDMDSVVVLGVGFMLQWWAETLAPDIVRSESVDRRVRAYLHSVLSDSPAYERDTVDAGGMVWYAIGRYELPSVAQRYTPTKSGRVRRFSTFRPGYGMTTSRHTEHERLTPLFTVKARNMFDAQQKAEQKISQMVASSDMDVKEKGLDFDSAWSKASRKMVSRDALQRLQRNLKNR